MTDNDFKYRLIGVVEATKADAIPLRLICIADVFAAGGYVDLAALLRAASDDIATRAVHISTPDARLMADMLAALQRLISDLVNPGDDAEYEDGEMPALDAARAAVAKAHDAMLRAETQSYDKGERAYVAQVAGLPLGDLGGGK